MGGDADYRKMAARIRACLTAMTNTPPDKSIMEHFREWLSPFQIHNQLVFGDGGIQLDEATKGQIAFSLELRPEHLNSIGVAHGGMVLTLLDVVLSGAARSDRLPEFTRAATIDLSTSFIRAAKGRLTARARVLRSGRSIVFCEGEIVDASDALVAKAIGSFKYDSPKPA